MGLTYVVRTNLPPAALTELGVEMFVMWLDFALGSGTLNGKRLYYPTGRYANSLRFEQRDASTVAIVADEGMAPEAAILESGHRSFDMKTTVQGGSRRVPMHRRPGSQPGVPLRRTGAGPPGLRPSVWAEVRGKEATGFATLSANSPAGSWVIPAMTPYSPGLTLAAMARRMSRDAGGA